MGNEVFCWPYGLTGCITQPPRSSSDPIGYPACPEVAMGTRSLLSAPDSEITQGSPSFILCVPWTFQAHSDLRTFTSATFSACPLLPSSCMSLCNLFVARQASLSMEFSGQEYWSRLPFPSPGDLPYPGIEPMSLTSPALAGRFSLSLAPPGKQLLYGQLFFRHLGLCSSIASPEALPEVTGR